MMVISQFGKIIRIDTKSTRAGGRSTSGVKLLNLESDDRVAAKASCQDSDAGMILVDSNVSFLRAGSEAALRLFAAIHRMRQGAYRRAC
jgi:DNA gyrase/topoisomerase IV subunit A